MHKKVKSVKKILMKFNWLCLSIKLNTLKDSKKKLYLLNTHIYTTNFIQNIHTFVNQRNCQKLLVITYVQFWQFRFFTRWKTYNNKKNPISIYISHGVHVHTFLSKSNFRDLTISNSDKYKFHIQNKFNNDSILKLIVWDSWKIDLTYK